MLIFVVCLNPLLNALEKKLAVVQIRRRGTKSTVIVYADDVTIIVSKPGDITVVKH
jgi:hypothetical protein